MRSKSDFDRQTRHVATLRNCVMHPVRPLVLGPADVVRIFGTVQLTIDLIERIGSVDEVDRMQ
jgi:hypothetical protein